MLRDVCRDDSAEFRPICKEPVHTSAFFGYGKSGSLNGPWGTADCSSAIDRRQVNIDATATDAKPIEEYRALNGIVSPHYLQAGPKLIVLLRGLQNHRR